MSKKNTSHAGSTQQFTELLDIIDDIVIFKGGMCAIVIEVQASNFALLSENEQAVRIASYANLLNSLSFPIQILIRNKKIDISSYVHLLNEQVEKAIDPHQSLSKPQNQKLIEHIKMYRNFVQDLVKVNVVLDKKFYIVISFSPLEAGPQGTKYMMQGNVNAQNIYTAAKPPLHTKADNLLTQLARLSLRSKVLGEEELIRLYYAFYNEGQQESHDVTLSIDSPVIKGAKQ